jgi:hypothetical protein
VTPGNALISFINKYRARNAKSKDYVLTAVTDFLAILTVFYHFVGRPVKETKNSLTKHRWNIVPKF